MLIKYTRYKAFTLAETLITLAIIGVVAAVTIPSLVQNWQNEAFESHFKKIYSELSNATNELVQENGGSLSTLFSTSDDIMNTYSAKFKYTKTCAPNQDAGVCWHNGTASWKRIDGRNGWGNETVYPRAILSNGALASFCILSSVCDSTNRCGIMTIDTNGFKGPNILGRDIFEFGIYSNKLRPSGVGSDFSQTCNKNNTTYLYGGVGCGAKIMMGMHVDD